ncbi:hypothetical protein CISG_03371 [Coccidioides immitis RMSCC 3703]|uniref:Secreted protein n=1 Tax=Coccidioides immitis RMSCC 3703 TaxID=454286 RepID=A0A0J8QL54_COCIT|nr:hypothetical protein CISG_03371 [Coccidioides immitis RMSCC 3703]
MGAERLAGAFFFFFFCAIVAPRKTVHKGYVNHIQTRGQPFSPTFLVSQIALATGEDDECICLCVIRKLGIVLFRPPPPLATPAAVRVARSPVGLRGLFPDLLVPPNKPLLLSSFVGESGKGPKKPI